MIQSFAIWFCDVTLLHCYKPSVKPATYKCPVWPVFQFKSKMSDSWKSRQCRQKDDRDITHVARTRYQNEKLASEGKPHGISPILQGLSKERVSPANMWVTLSFLPANETWGNLSARAVVSILVSLVPSPQSSSLPALFSVSSSILSSFWAVIQMFIISREISHLLHVSSLRPLFWAYCLHKYSMFFISNCEKHPDMIFPVNSDFLVILCHLG